MHKNKGKYLIIYQLIMIFFMLKVVDLFCGPGGMSTGFEMAGFETICALDNSKYAVETFSKNRGNPTGRLWKNLITCRP
mgnify:CR=1 FL=1